MKYIEVRCGNEDCSNYNIIHKLKLNDFMLKIWDADINQMQTYPNILDTSKINNLECIKCFWKLNCEVENE